MATTPRARVAGLMLLAGVLGLGAVLSAPADTHIGGHVAGRAWSPALLVYVGRRAVPSMAGALAGRSSSPPSRSAAIPLGVSAGYAVAIVVEGLRDPQGAHRPVGLRPPSQRRPRPRPLHPRGAGRLGSGRRPVRPHARPSPTSACPGRSCVIDVRHPPGLPADPARPSSWRSSATRARAAARRRGSAGRSPCWSRSARSCSTQAPGAGLLRAPADRLGRPARAHARGPVAAGRGGHAREHR